MIIHVNGEARDHTAPARTHLADLLREHFGLTGTHLGCEQGVCGACTVLLDGAPTRACLIYAHEAAGHEVTTIEGLDDDPTAVALRAAFTRHHALQCGYCTPGMMITARDIVLRLGEVDEARIREELAGNLCRCTGYRGIVRAVAEVASGRAAAFPMTSAGLTANAPAAAARAVPYSAPTQLTAIVPASIAMAGPDTVTSQPASISAEQRPDAGLPHRITHTLPIALPLAAAWAILSDPIRAAACLPGASLTRHDGEAIEGAVAVSLGPITARLAGAGTLKIDHAAHAALLTGQGRDGPNAARGDIVWRLEPAPEGCVLQLELGWRLTGPLAQFSRPALVGGLVRAIASEFAANVVRAAAGQAIAPRASLLGLLRLWLKTLLRR